MSNLSSIDKLPNMAAKTDAVSPCKQITYTTDVTPVKWGYFFCMYIWKDVIQLFLCSQIKLAFLCCENLLRIRG